MAADSAGTTGGKILNSNNKLFMLSKRRPVGIMIYGSSDIMGYPWETIVKMYRKLLGKTSFPTLSEYVEHFKKYLRESELFDEKSKKLYIESVFEIVADDIIKIIKAIFPDIKTMGKEVLNLYFSQIVSEKKQTSERESIKCELTEEERNAALAAHKDFSDKLISEKFGVHGISKETIGDIYEIMKNAIFKNPDIYGGSSGLVFSGFGEEDVFPSAISFMVSSVINKKIMMSEQSSNSIDLETDSIISPFAQRDMMESFVYGIDPGVKNEIARQLNGMFLKIPQAVTNLMRFSAEQSKALEYSFKSVLGTLSVKFFNKTDAFIRDNYIIPILQGVATLPPEDLAMMAETLVSLTSFKRKISANQTETVGGPVDVATITKGDGFIWIKRKHYFQADKNHHFFSNYYSEEQANEIR